jgi:NAD(P)-dependent dehydrogenase (short-subunit alcohol dehydrogenase family)
MIIDLTEEARDDTIDTDLKGTVVVTQIVARKMVEQGCGGKVVDIVFAA